MRTLEEQLIDIDMAVLLEVWAYSPKGKALHRWMIGEDFELSTLRRDIKEGRLTAIKTQINYHNDELYKGLPDNYWEVNTSRLPKSLLRSLVTHVEVTSLRDGLRVWACVEIDEQTAWELIEKLDQHEGVIRPDQDSQ